MIYHFVSLLYQNDKTKPGYGQLYQKINDVEKQSNQGSMAEIIQRLDDMLRQINKSAESWKPMHQMKYINT
jgi:hypothetical protein